MGEHGMPAVSDERIHTGGLMRCCIASWDAAMGTARRWQDGDVIECIVNDDSHRMVREGGIWSWSFPPLAEEVPTDADRV